MEPVHKYFSVSLTANNAKCPLAPKAARNKGVLGVVLKLMVDVV